MLYFPAECKRFKKGISADWNLPLFLKGSELANAQLWCGKISSQPALRYHNYQSKHSKSWRKEKKNYSVQHSTVRIPEMGISPCQWASVVLPKYSSAIYWQFLLFIIFIMLWSQEAKFFNKHQLFLILNPNFRQSSIVKQGKKKDTALLLII